MTTRPTNDRYLPLLGGFLATLALWLAVTYAMSRTITGRDAAVGLFVAAVLTAYFERRRIP